MKTPVTLLAGIGATAVAFAFALASALTMVPAASAQLEPPDGEVRAELEAGRAGGEAPRAEAYDEFVGGLAAELSVDAAAVDGAIRATLSGIVDDRQAAGELSLEDAAALKARIEVSETPLLPGMMGAFAGADVRFSGRHGRRGGFDGGRGDHRIVLPPDGVAPGAAPAEEAVGGVNERTGSPATDEVIADGTPAA